MEDPPKPFKELNIGPFHYCPFPRIDADCVDTQARKNPLAALFHPSKMTSRSGEPTSSSHKIYAHFDQNDAELPYTFVYEMPGFFIAPEGEPLPNEYARVETDRSLLPASVSQQDQYWLLRSRLTQAIASNWQTILDSCPEIAHANAALNTYKRLNPTRSFQMYPKEHCDFTDTATNAPSTPPILR